MAVSPVDVEGRLSRLRDASVQPYIVSTASNHSTSNWLLAASTTANSAGFYFAMSAKSEWLTVASATMFVLAITSTFICGRFVATIRAFDAEAADNLRRVDLETAAELFKNADSAADNSSAMSATLDKWTTATILLMLAGGLCLVIGKALTI